MSNAINIQLKRRHSHKYGVDENKWLETKTDTTLERQKHPPYRNLKY